MKNDHESNFKTCSKIHEKIEVQLMFYASYKDFL